MGTTARRRTGGTLVAIVVALLASLLAPTIPAALADSPTALADTAAEARVVDLVNRERLAAGLDELTVSPDLTEVARRHSTVMRDRDELHHNPDLATDVDGWRTVGENVGVGGRIDAVHAAFLASPDHRRNVLEAEYHEVGIGVIVQDGRAWITQVFRTPASGQPSPTTALGAIG